MQNIKTGDKVKILSSNPFWENKIGVVKSNIINNDDSESLIKVAINLGANKTIIQTFTLNELSLLDESEKMSEILITENLDNEKDSLGNSLSPQQISYFKDSKVRDKDGNLLVCYHGSSAEFDTFDNQKIRRGNSLGKGFYFSSDSNTSAGYSKTNNVKNVYLNIKNPYTFIVTGARQQFLLEIAMKYNIPRRDNNGKIINLNDAVSDVLKANKFDGVIAYIPHEDSYEIVVYESNQIKDITNKNPTTSSNIFEYAENDSENTSIKQLEKAFIESFINKDCKFLGYEYDELYAKHENDKGDYVFDSDDLEYINYYKYLETLKCKIINCAMLDYSSKKSIMENFKDSFWDLIFENGDTLTAISGESIQLLDKSIFENYLTESIITPRTADLIESYFGEDIDWLFVSKIATAEDIPESEIIENALQNKYKVIAITTEYKSTYIILAKHTDEKSLLRDYASYLPGFKKIERIK